MRFTQLFGKTLRKPPKDETSVNARLLEQAGFVSKLMSGVYTYLPLGVRVLDRINAIIRTEMNVLGGQEVYMPALHPRELWDTTGRWESLKEIMYQFTDAGKKELGLATTHEELVAQLAQHRINSYKDLPFAIYQIQTKYRNEPRAKSGLIRSREFLMKDLYSFHASEDDLNTFYDRVKTSYVEIFRQCGVAVRITDASGGVFSKQYSHEFQVLSDSGEDKLIYCPSCTFTQNAEVAQYSVGAPCPQCATPVREGKGIEVGNIFKLGTKFSEAFGVSFLDKDGKKRTPIMASYGIGPGRLMGTIVEIHHDDKGIIWPDSVSPYSVHIVQIGDDDSTRASLKELLRLLEKKGIEYLLDDRAVSPGIKFADADLIGVPTRLVVSSKTGDQAEMKSRDADAAKLLHHEKIIEVLLKH